MPFDPLAPMYSAVEVALAILLAALPMSRIAEILLALIQRKLGITLKPKGDSNDGTQ